MQYSLPNDRFSRVGCIRRLATEQHLKLNSLVINLFLLKTLLYSAVIYDKCTRNALDSDDIVYSLF